MLLKDTFRPDRKPMSIADALEKDVYDSDGGVAERADRNAENAIKLIGKLLETLHDKKVLSDNEVIEFIGRYRWERAE